MNIYLMKKPKRINSVSVSLAILGLILLYVCWFLVPAFWPIFQLTGIMRGACNDAYKQLDNEVVMQTLLKNARRTGLQLSKENFQLSREQYTPEDLKQFGNQKPEFITFVQKRGKACVLKMRYQDNYTWPLVGETTQLTFEREVRVDLKPIQYKKTGPFDCTCAKVPNRS